jgi:hypothetical protein
MLLDSVRPSSRRGPALVHQGSGVATVLFGAFSFEEKAGKDNHYWLLISGISLKAIILHYKKPSLVTTLKPEEQ